jgi:prolyl oligopeptidase
VECPDIPPEATVASLQWLESTGSTCVSAWSEAQSQHARATLETSAAEAVQRLITTGRDASLQPVMSADVRKHRGFIYRVDSAQGTPGQLLLRAPEHEAPLTAEGWQRVASVADLDLPDGDWRIGLSGLHFSPSDDRLLLTLSRGGSDVAVLCEVSLRVGEVLATPFRTEVARKLSVEYKDDHTLYLAAGLREAERSVADYSLVVREWRRGEALTEARLVYRGRPELLAVSVVLVETASYRQPLLMELEDFESGAKVHALVDETADHHSVRVQALPLRMPVLFAFGAMAATGSSLLTQYDPLHWSADGLSFQAGDWIAIDLPALIADSALDEAVSLVYRPAANEGTFLFSASSGASGIGATQTGFLLVVLRDLYQRVSSFSRGINGMWQERVLIPEAAVGLGIPGYGDPLSKSAVVSAESFVIPRQSMLVGDDGATVPVMARSRSAEVSAVPRIRRQFAIADDGARIPYYLVAEPAADAKEGLRPVLMSGYGGFGVPISPAYRDLVAGAIHRKWLNAGGIYVLAAARGGGEYGPSWYQAGRVIKRQRSYDDYQIVAQHLIASGVTEAGRIGWIGASNAGLTAGVLATQRADLFGAAVALVPVLDMDRYHRLLAGPNWIPEYGSPEDPDIRQALLEYSPLHHADAAAVAPMLLVTTTSDDRVHPGHARKMTARLQSFGHEALFLEYENGGHVLDLTAAEREEFEQLVLGFLVRSLRLGKPP